MPAIKKKKKTAPTRARRSQQVVDGRPGTSRLKRAIAHIVETTSPARLFELYYWTQDPGLLKLLRSLARLSPENRRTVEAFFQFATDQAKVSAQIGPKGQLILNSRHMSEAMAMLGSALEADEHASSAPKPH